MKNLLLIGCGNIGYSLLKVFVERGFFDKIIVVQPSQSQAVDFVSNTSVQFVSTAAEIPHDFQCDIVLLTVKPQHLQQVANDIAPYIGEALLVSVLSGVSINSLSSSLNTTKVMRIMPNMAIKFGQSVNLAFSENLDQIVINRVNEIFSASGEMVWLNNEDLIEKLTAISGSGPAYFFLLAEKLVEGMMEVGIDQKMARKIATQVLSGSASLASTTGDFPALMASVTSKGGVTEAALAVMAPEFQQTIPKALAKAFERVQELSGS